MARALSNIWGQAVSLSESEIPEDELAELVPVAHDRLLARKALKQAEAQDAESEKRKLLADAEEHKRQEAAQLETLLVRAEHWDHTDTEYGGRHITQAQAQETRRYIADHRHETVAWGVQHGHFRTEAEGHRFVDCEGRLHALNAADRTGTMTDAQRAERARLEQQQQPYSALQGHVWDMTAMGRGPQVVAPPQAAPAPLSAGSSPVIGTNDENPFRSRTPDMKGSFAVQAEPAGAPQTSPLPEVAAPVPVAARSLAVAGLS